MSEIWDSCTFFDFYSWSQGVLHGGRFDLRNHLLCQHLEAPQALTLERESHRNLEL